MDVLVLCLVHRGTHKTYYRALYLPRLKFSQQNRLRALRPENAAFIRRADWTDTFPDDKPGACSSRFPVVSLPALKELHYACVYLKCGNWGSRRARLLLPEALPCELARSSFTWSRRGRYPDPRTVEGRISKGLARLVQLEHLELAMYSDQNFQVMKVDVRAPGLLSLRLEGGAQVSYSMTQTLRESCLCLRELHIDARANIAIAPGTLPACLERLTLGRGCGIDDDDADGGGGGLVAGMFPDGLLELRICGDVTTYCHGLLPPRLESLVCGGAFATAGDRDVLPGFFPASLRRLDAAEYAPRAAAADRLPAARLEFLRFSGMFASPLAAAEYTSLSELRLTRGKAALAAALAAASGGGARRLCRVAAAHGRPPSSRRTCAFLPCT